MILGYDVRDSSHLEFGSLKFLSQKFMVEGLSIIEERQYPFVMDVHLKSATNYHFLDELIEE